MTDRKLLLYLNWFYTLELSQVNFYLSQAEKSEDEYISHFLLHLVEIEINHARKIKSFIDLFGGNTSKVASNLSKISSIFAELTTYFGTVNMFFLNYHLETLAYKDYLSFFRKLDSRKKHHKELAEVLLSNLIEEDLHRNWFISQREALNKLKDD